ncbi:MAG: GIY-YIG nuclease family protein [Sphingomonas sp.]|uniref:GIY-YIG nuclease family protein n=1 Tax=Sphingomonas sp. TaxID=28214 RepID=UPI001B18EC0E|nr:GIY-YIG nuclease family protein [Sphingomonas sp.]MBO9624140.1 GIY-YIG nuclease family protein [Sphingomonas sp.]
MNSLVYFIRPVGERDPVKIGCTTLIHDRLAGLNLWAPTKPEIAATIPGSYDLERRFHALFLAQNDHGEWFRWSPELELVISEIVAGTFDEATLPQPTWLQRPRKAKPDKPRTRKADRQITYCDEYLLRDIEGFLRKTGMAASAFGRRAVGDPAFVAGLRKGRNAYANVSRRVRSFMLDAANASPLHRAASLHGDTGSASLSPCGADPVNVEGR